MLLRMQVSRGRLLAIAALGLLVVLVGVAVRTSNTTSATAGVDAINRAGLALYVPVTALVFASAVFGEMVEDSTLVYLWARPVRRRDLTVAGIASSLTVSLPFVLVPMGIMAVVVKADGGLLVGTLVASALATVAYTTLFVGLGARVPRALLWGLVYVAVWEGLVAGAGRAIARTSLRLYANSILRAAAGAPAAKYSVGTATAVIVLVVVAVAGVALTTWLLTRADVA
jgi:ABC-2 type transport system permease protein